MKTLLVACVALLCSTLASNSPAQSKSQPLQLIAFGMHVKCTSTRAGQNPDCTSETPWPSIPQAPDPSRPFGSLRMHDDGTKFGNVQARQTPACNGTITSGCAWGAFDEWIRDARRHRTELLYTFSKTPEWACSKHQGCASSDVPEDKAFVNFAAAVRDRMIDGRTAGCRTSDANDSGCIRYWEVWNEPNNGKSAWCGSIAAMVHVARLINETVRATDAHAKVVSPGVGYTAGYNGTSCSPGAINGEQICSKWGKANGNPEAYICEFLRQRGSGSGDRAGRDYVDIVGWHAYPTNSRLQSMAEDAVIRRAPNIQTVMGDQALSVCASGQTTGCTPLWITETSWGYTSRGYAAENELGKSDCDLPQGCPRINPENDNMSQSCDSDDPPSQYGCWAHDQAAYMVKLYTIALASGVDRVFWYWWDGQPWGTLYCKAPNAAVGCSAIASAHPYLLNAAHAYGVAQQWLVGRTLRSCESAADGSWSCALTGSDGKLAEIVWNPSGPKEYRVGSGYSHAYNIYGRTIPFGKPLTISYSPVLLEGPP